MEDKKPIYSRPNVTLEDFYQHFHNALESNNYVFRVEVVMTDGTSPLRIVFESPKGMVTNQRKRIGKLEVF